MLCIEEVFPPAMLPSTEQRHNTSKIPHATMLYPIHFTIALPQRQHPTRAAPFRT